MSQLLAAAIQLSSGLDVEENIAAAAQGVEAAASAGAGLAVLPEMWPLLAPDKLRAQKLALARERGEELKALMAGWARRFGFWLVGGSIFTPAGADRIHNHCSVFDPQGQEVASYDKLHLFDLSAPGFGKESDLVQAGDRLAMFNMGPWHAGLSICYDLRFPALYQRLSAAGANILMAPSAFTQKTGEAHWLLLNRCRAVENQCYIIAANQSESRSPGMACFGHSLIAGPWGEILACREETGPGIVLAELSLERITEVRGKLPILRHRRDVAKLEIHSSKGAG